MNKPITMEDAKKFFPSGSTVYLIIRKKSSSGMQREIGIVVFKNGSDLHPNYMVSELTGYKVNKDGDGVVVRGAGMDMGFHLVSHLSQLLYGKDTALKHRWL